MRISELLISIASWLESSDNEVALLAEYDDAALQAAVKACVKAAHILKQGAAEVDQIEPVEETTLTTEKLNYLNDMATAFDKSGDPDLQKTASVIDELLFTIAAPPKWAETMRKNKELELDTIKRQYEEAKKQLDEFNGVKEAVKAIDKSPFFKEPHIMEHALSTRSCPDHAGAQMGRVGDHMWQCSLDKKVYNYLAGYTTEKGEKVPGEDVAGQTRMYQAEPHALFDTRESRLTGLQR